MNPQLWSIRFRHAIAALCVAGVFGALQSFAWANDPCPDRTNLEIACGVDAILSYFRNEGANFGAGIFDAATGESTADPEWAEGYAEPWLEVRIGLEDRGALYAGASVVGELTTDATASESFANSASQRVDDGNLYLGWCSDRFPESQEGPTDCEAPVNISFGRQYFALGDSFLIDDSFELAALLQVQRESLDGAVFHLRGDGDQDDTKLWGANLDYALPGTGTTDAQWSGSLGLMYLHVLESSPFSYGPRDGMDVYSIRATGLTHAATPGLSLWGEYVRERGSGSGARFDANAWYVEGRYELGGAWSINLAYRYARFSGDPDPFDSTSEAFDPLFYGLNSVRTNGWGTWYQGEVTGEYLLFNSNQENHMLHVSATPWGSDLVLGLSYWWFDLLESNYAGTPVSGLHFADEVNIYANWTLSNNISLYALYGVAIPGDAAIQALGDNKPFHVFETYIYITF